ncbi:hypothetical protein C0Q70_08133 [Pomacea canaliculata]|uniref:Uncharacterized protein n=1 Tax=Pomacea canaliculata TaxID=400727 RepID=A0A2T7PH08_POMCA|nr:hypothetical protein C0Q70_08133 [Pomacea canaliculata]
MDTDDEPLIMDGSCPLTTQPTPVVQPYFDNPPPGYYPPSSPYGPVPGAPINHHTTTTVIINQPSPMTVAGPRLWSSDLCSCCDDMGIWINHERLLCDLLLRNLFPLSNGKRDGADQEFL